MRPLSVAEYTLAEKLARVQITTSAIQFFQPSQFQSMGYPTRIELEGELVRFIDATNESLSEDYLNMILQGLTSQELEMLRGALDRISRFTRQWFDRTLIPKAGMLNAVNILRHLKFIYGDARPSVFEFGPGSGSVGALCMLDGYPYAATDVTMALYMYQNHVWNYLSGGKVLEGALSPLTLEAFRDLPGGAAIHVPWWDFSALTPDAVPSFDVITCNHMLTEMHEFSQSYSFAIARSFLNNDNGLPKAVVFFGWGWDPGNRRAETTRRFYEAGFSLVHHDRWIAVFAPAGTRWAQGGLSLPQGDTGFYPAYYSSDENPLSKAVRRGRDELAPRKTATSDDVRRIWAHIMGDGNFLSDDEKFWQVMKFRSHLGKEG